MKDVGLRIRLEPELRDDFIKICHNNHMPAAQVLREFMRSYVQTNRTNAKSRNTSLAGKKSK